MTTRPAVFMLIATCYTLLALSDRAADMLRWEPSVLVILVANLFTGGILFEHGARQKRPSYFDIGAGVFGGCIGLVIYWTSWVSDGGTSLEEMRFILAVSAVVCLARARSLLRNAQLYKPVGGF